jgi:hypothetical protein
MAGEEGEALAAGEVQPRRDAMGLRRSLTLPYAVLTG